MTNNEKRFFLINQNNLIFKILKEDNSFKLRNDNKNKEIYSLIKKYKEENFLLTTMTAIDEIEKQNRFLIQTVLINYKEKKKIYLNENVKIKAQSKVEEFPSAIWLEREIYDLFGIFFEKEQGEKDLRRILTDYNFKGHPLRKDFSLIGYNEKYYSYKSKTIKNRKDIIF